MTISHEDIITIETPEHVVFEYQLAGLGSRIVAAFLDLCFVLLAGVILLIGAAIVGAMGGEMGTLAIGVAILSAFLLIWGYPVFFEIFWKGQTPGKRIMGMRVIREGGYALTPSAVLVRNLLRVADFLPIAFLAGLVVMMASKRYKRIGDFVAGTLVIRDRPSVVVPDRLETKRLQLADDEVVAELRKAGVHRLPPELIYRLEELVQRRDLLEQESRLRLIQDFAAELARRLGVRVRGAYRFLQNVVYAYREDEKAVAGGTAGEAQFVKRGRPDWMRLESFANRLEGAGAKPTGRELFTFVSVYRKVAGDLARARMLRMRPTLVDYLNQLVGKVHFRVYSAAAYPIGKLVDFYVRIFPATVRRLWGYVAASTALFLLPALAAYVATRENPALADAFAPGFAEKAEEMYGHGFSGRTGAESAAMTSFYIANNVQVSFLAFALGIFLGLGSAYIIVKNGLVLGGFIALIQRLGFSETFWSFVSSHAGVELGAIVLAGAAGMRLGLSFVNPGMLTRKDALITGARDAGIIMFGVASMLVIAAMLEAWVSPSTLPNPAKWTLGVVNLFALFVYFLFVGRKARNEPSSEQR